MEHIPGTESDIQKVIRIAKVLDISIEEAAVTCDAFHMAFSDDRMRRAIFDVIDELDRRAAGKGEPPGLIINYAVQLGMDGIGVERYADEIPAGEIVELTPPHRANILLKINDNFPTQQFLGPLIVNRPGWHFDTFDPNAEIAEQLSHPEPAGEPICLGPIRLTLNERFQFLSTAGSSSELNHNRPPLTASAHSASCRPLTAVAASQHGEPTSGLSPPLHTENLEHSGSKDVPLAFGNQHVETCVSHLDL
jgi:hypothetical protein